MATTEGHIDKVRKNIRSKNHLDEEDPEETAINKTGEITNPSFLKYTYQ